MNSDNTAGPSRVHYPPKPFVSAHHRPERSDGKFRVVLVSTGSVASIKIPEIVRELSRDPHISIQVVATQSSQHFYTQQQLDDAVLIARGRGADGGDDDMGDEETLEGVRMWRDEDEWSDWKKVGDPILHIELRRWADLVVVAPCSADFLAKLAAGFTDNLALSMMRALTPSTPVIICPAMNTHMYQHPLTEDHLRLVQSRLGYLISGPQGVGTLACGDEGPGKMTDWRDIVNMIENFSAKYISENPINPFDRNRSSSKPNPLKRSSSRSETQHVSSNSTSRPTSDPQPTDPAPTISATKRETDRPPTPPTPGMMNSYNNMIIPLPPDEIKPGHKSKNAIPSQQFLSNGLVAPLHSEKVKSSGQTSTSKFTAPNQEMTDTFLYNNRPVPVSFIGETRRPLSNGSSVGRMGPIISDVSGSDGKNGHSQWRTWGDANGGDGRFWSNKWWTG